MSLAVCVCRIALGRLMRFDLFLFSIKPIPFAEEIGAGENNSRKSITFASVRRQTLSRCPAGRNGILRLAGIRNKSKRCRY